MKKDEVASALHWLSQFDRFHIRPGLERMEAMLAALGRPDRHLRFLHIAGTNGKGSTGAFLGQVLRAHGWSVGLFASPAIMHDLDRIQYNGNRISDAAFVHGVKRMQAVIETLSDKPTEFEVITVLALMYFGTEVQPDFVIWETGLGGRLDSTNVITPEASVITNVGHDHMSVLGESLTDIAREKAGIIKPECPVVTAAVGEAESIIHEQAAIADAPYFVLSRHARVENAQAQPSGWVFAYEGLNRRWQNLSIRLLGRHQLDNAALSLLTLEVLEQSGAVDLDPVAVRRGLRDTVWPGRMEYLQEQPRLLLDAAHNREAVSRLIETLQEHVTYDKLRLVIGVFADKEVERVTVPLGRLADEVIATAGSHPRYLPSEILRAKTQGWLPHVPVTDSGSPEVAVQQAVARSGADDLVLVAGSHDLMRIIRKYWLGEEKTKVGEGR